MGYEIDGKECTLCICKECNHEEWVEDEEIFEAYQEGDMDEDYNIILMCPECGGDMIMTEEE